MSSILVEYSGRPLVAESKKRLMCEMGNRYSSDGFNREGDHIRQLMNGCRDLGMQAGLLDIANSTCGSGLSVIPMSMSAGSLARESAAKPAWPHQDSHAVQLRVYQCTWQPSLVAPQ